MALNVAIYGYDTNIGKLVLECLEEDEDNLIAKLYPLSPLKGEYDAVKLKGTNYLITHVDEFDFSKADCALFLTTPDESARLAGKARSQGCTVIDNSRQFSGSADAPLIMGQINPYKIKEAVQKRLCVPATSVATALCLSLGPLHDEFEVVQAQACALESVSEHGSFGTETLVQETAYLLNGRSLDDSGFPAQVAFNVHSRIGDLKENGDSAHESLIKQEVQELLGPFEQGLSVTSLLVPVFYGHTVCVHVQLLEKTTVEGIIEAFKSWPELKAVDDNEEFLTPVSHGVAEDKILCGRIRQSSSGRNAFDFMLMLDNSRRGEALNCVEILKLLNAELSDRAL